MAKATTTTTRKRSKADPNETKAQKFVRLANMRMTNALRAINGIRALANKSAYEFNAEQVKKITATLTDAVSGATTALNNPGSSAVKGGFQL